VWETGQADRRHARADPKILPPPCRNGRLMTERRDPQWTLRPCLLPKWRNVRSLHTFLGTPFHSPPTWIAFCCTIIPQHTSLGTRGAIPDS
jgi:hypothetical protein